jgi:ankyrin repeat protein
VDVDGDGNTPFHKDAVSFRGIDALNQLVALGVDPNQANNAGRLPLHALCSVGWYDIYLDESLVEHTQWFLQHTTNVDAPDVNGVRVLHVASMMSEYLVKAILASGADPAGATFEGLAPLHLAARARQSNIVGILLDALKARASKSASGSLSDINARDEMGRSPLHYACRSGRHETVALLLAAGADAHAQDNQGLNSLDACAEFGEEQQLWDDYRKPDKFDWESLALTSIARDWNQVAVAGTGLRDTLRPWVIPGRAIKSIFLKTYGQASEEVGNNASGGIRSCQDTTRLREILRMLQQAHSGDPESASSFIQHVSRCVQKLKSAVGDAYTLRCFSEFAAEISDIERLDYPGDKWSDDESSVDEKAIGILLRRREYGAIERLLRHASPLCSTPKKTAQTVKILRLFAKLGFADLMAAILESNADDVEKLLSTSELDGKPVDALLLLACQRELPNMDVVRLLVETGRVNINARCRTMAERVESQEDVGWTDVENEPDPGLNTALHDVATARNWWCVTQAIPYLLSHGADTAVLNEAEQTPLKIAEEYLPWGTFRSEAIEALKGAKCDPGVESTYCEGPPAREV